MSGTGGQVGACAPATTVERVANIPMSLPHVDQPRHRFGGQRALLLAGLEFRLNSAEEEREGIHVNGGGVAHKHTQTDTRIAPPDHITQNTHTIAPFCWAECRPCPPSRRPCPWAGASHYPRAFLGASCRPRRRHRPPSSRRRAWWRGATDRRRNALRGPSRSRLSRERRWSASRGSSFSALRGSFAQCDGACAFCRTVPRYLRGSSRRC